jgi:hypothetical protein
MMNARMAA